MNLARLLFNDMVHQVLPSPGAEFWIAAVHVNAGKGEIEMRLALRVASRLEQPLSFCFIARLQTGLLASGFILDVIDAPGTSD